MTENQSMSLSERFALFSFTPVTTDVVSFSPVTASAEGAWSATSYYLDSSGRSRFFLPLQLGCRTKEDVDRIVSSGCIQPPPKNVQRSDEEQETTPACFLRLEVQSSSIGESISATMEGITIHSSAAEGNSIILDTEVILRACSQPVEGNQMDIDNSNYRGLNRPPVVVTRLEVTAVLVQRTKASKQKTLGAGLMALELGGGSLPLGSVTKSSNPQFKQTRLGPFAIDVSLTHALNISAKSVSGMTSGSTLVSLTMMHSNTHAEPVTVTNIALHPGHSRQDALFLKDRSIPGGGRSITDMSKHVQWGYAPQTEPKLPLTLQPHDAYSTVLTVHATDTTKSRIFVSPISVTAVLGDETNCNSGRHPRVTVATDAQWKTGRVVVEPSDAFRVNMKIRVEDGSCFVGAPFTVSLRLSNLSENSRDLILVTAKDGDDGSDRTSTMDAPALADVNGYTFGVWGLSDEDGSAALQKRGHELLAVDATLLLGEVKGEQTVETEIRFVPLKEGTLRIPDFRIYDRTEGTWYICEHKLSVVVTTRSN